MLTANRLPGSAMGLTFVILVVLTASSLAACISNIPSELTVHNRTIVPIAFATGLDDPTNPAWQYVPACSTVRFGWDLYWRPMSSADIPSAPPDGAVPVEIVDRPPPDGTIIDTVIVSSTGVLGGYGPPESVASLPPCEGVPPSASPPVQSPR